MQPKTGRISNETEVELSGFFRSLRLGSREYQGRTQPRTIRIAAIIRQRQILILGPNLESPDHHL